MPKQPNQFDEAATEAEGEFSSLMKEFGNKKMSAIQVVESLQGWWKNHYMKAGHKRLGRVLVGTWKTPTG